MSRRKHRHDHTADTRHWSATQAARSLIDSRDLTLQFSLSNPTVAVMAADDLRRAIYGYAEAAGRSGASDPLGEALRWTGRPHLIGRPLTDDVLLAEATSHILRCLRDLEAADPYIISPAMHATTIAAAYTLTDDESLMFRVDDLPSPNGVLLLPTHMIVEPGGDAMPQDFIALSWHTSVLNRGGSEVPVIAVRSWLDTHGPIQVDGFTEAMKMMRQNGMHMPPWMLLGNSVLTFRDNDDDDTPEIDDIAREMMTVSLIDRKSNLKGRGDVSREYDGESMIVGEQLSVWPQKYLLAFFRLAGQQIATVSSFREGIDARAKPQRHHETRVVQLRSYSDSTGTDDGGDGEKRKYSVQFTVRMHKVNQWYPKEGTHKLIWRGPFIKGPKDAPMMEGVKVKALTR